MLTARAFRTVAAVEAISWLALIVATVIKYSADAPLGVKILGPVHGALFIGYVLLALQLRAPMRWSAGTFLIVLIDAVVPGGGLLVARRPDLQARVTAA